MFPIDWYHIIIPMSWSRSSFSLLSTFYIINIIYSKFMHPIPFVSQPKKITLLAFDHLIVAVAATNSYLGNQT